MWRTYKGTVYEAVLHSSCFENSPPGRFKFWFRYSMQHPLMFEVVSVPSKTSRVSFKSVESSSTDQQFVDLPPPSYTAATKKNSPGSQDRVAPRDNSGSPGSMKNHPSVLKKELPLQKSSYSEFDHKQAASTSFIKLVQFSVKSTMLGFSTPVKEFCKSFRNH